MSRIVLIALALLGAGGFAVAWMAFAPSATNKGQLSPTATFDVRHSFALGTADIANDKESLALAVDARGRIVLGWASVTGDLEQTIWLARSDDQGQTFTEPAAFRKTRIYRYTSRMRNTEVTRSTSTIPRLAACGETIALAWTESLDGGAKVAFLCAQSTDGGRSFSEPIALHSEEASKPGFTAMTAGPKGVAGAWLDSRNKAQQVFGSLLAWNERKPTESMVFAGPDGKGVCPCCDMAALAAADGSTIVAFRNSDSGFRDIWLTRSKSDGRFKEPVCVTDGHWTFQGCPHDGPALALSGKQLQVAWMDAHTGPRRIYLAGAGIDDLHFSGRELCPEIKGEQGHPKLTAAPDGGLHVVWDNSLADEVPAPDSSGHHHGPDLTGSGRAIYHVALPDGGTNVGVARAIDPRAGLFQTRPVVSVAPTGEVYVAYHETSQDGKSVVFVRLSQNVARPAQSK